MADTFDNAERVISSYLDVLSYDDSEGAREYTTSYYNHPSHKNPIPADFIEEVLDKFIPNLRKMTVSRAKVTTLKDYL